MTTSSLRGKTARIIANRSIAITRATATTDFLTNLTVGGIKMVGTSEAVRTTEVTASGIEVRRETENLTGITIEKEMTRTPPQ